MKESEKISRRQALRLMAGATGAILLGCTPRRNEEVPSQTASVTTAESQNGPADSVTQSHTTLDLPSHPSPSHQEINTPDDLIVLSDETHKKIVVEGYPEIELGFSGSPDNENDPFIISVSPSAIRQTVELLKQENIIREGDRIRLVFVWPGDENGPVYDCTDGAIVNVSMLSLARPVYDHVYIPFFKDTGVRSEDEKKLFQTLANNQINLIIWHELEHHRHCKEGQRDITTAEEEAIEAEYRRARNYPPMVYVQLKPEIDVEQVMRYFENILR